MRALKIIGYIVLVLVLLVAMAGFYVKTFLPNTGSPANVKIDITPERVERGKYLANHVTLCIDCHSTRDWSLYAGPMVNGKEGCGGEYFDQHMGFPGQFVSPNISQAKLASWTDGEVLRAVTTGVSKDGHALFPIMGYLRFGKMDKEDIYSIIAYIRTLKPQQNEPPKSKADFPVNFLINTMPQKAEFTTRPDPSDKISYGSYLANAAGCVECHSIREKGKIVPGTEFGGGMEFQMPTCLARSANITPDEQTGIGKWTVERFVERFKRYTDSSYTAPKVGAKDVNTPMPWMMYAGMEKNDLEAIYAYLHQVKPLSHKVMKFD